MPPKCPHCGHELLCNPGLTERVQCLHCGYPTKRTPASPAPAKRSDVERLRDVADAATSVWLARLAVMRITASDKDGADAQFEAVEHLNQARKHFQDAGIPWPEMVQ
jgi:ribosomal protein L37E